MAHGPFRTALKSKSIYIGMRTVEQRLHHAKYEVIEIVFGFQQTGWPLSRALRRNDQAGM